MKQWEAKKREFEEKFNALLENVPEEILNKHYYRIGWFSESPYPIFDLSFINKLPDNILNEVIQLHENYIRNINR